MRNLLFWDVDTQRDFIQPGGKLYVPRAEKIVHNLERLTTAAAQAGIPLVSSMDAHQPGDPEFGEYPPHCLAGTPGQEKIAATLLVDHYVVPNHSVELPGDLTRHQQIILEKQDVDVFTNPNVDEVLRRLGEREVVLYGVVTEICVAHAARGLIRRGYRVHMVWDAVRHLDVNRGYATADEITSHGGLLLTTDEVLRIAQTKQAA
jgi:nicotinamidase/pyrazinamidase